GVNLNIDSDDKLFNIKHNLIGLESLGGVSALSDEIFLPSISCTLRYYSSPIRWGVIVYNLHNRPQRL
ncbi:MAG: hypothetical protein AAFV90_30165, partial [Cyanobacteria bacterium J06634_5]